MIQLRADGGVRSGLLAAAMAIAVMGIALLVVPIPRESGEEAPAGDWLILRNESILMYEKLILRNELRRRVVDYVYIVVPRNTSFQKCYIKELKPGIFELRVDEDGNTFAVVRMEAEPGERVVIEAAFRIVKAEYKVLWENVKTAWPRLDDARRLSGPTAVWNVDNSTLRDLAELYGAGDEPLEVVRGLAEWIKAHLDYRVLGTRLGSDHAILRIGGSLVVRGDCVEVCDVLVTLARIRGIPARAAFGFLLSYRDERMWLNFTREEGEELLSHWGGHMWPQVLIEPLGWIDVELLEGGEVKVGDYSWRHVLLGVEETRYYGTTLSNFCIPGSLTLEYVEVSFRSEEG